MGTDVSLSQLPEVLNDLAARVRNLECELGTLRSKDQADGREWVPARDAADTFPSIFPSGYNSVRWLIATRRSDLEAGEIIRQSNPRGPIHFHRHRLLAWWEAEGRAGRSRARGPA